MAEICFTPHLERFLTVPPLDISGGTLAEVIDSVCEQNPRLRSYLLDDQGALRRHVVVFIDGEILADRELMSDAVGEQSEVYIMQALSGGQE